jgi:hypothetical protein
MGATRIARAFAVVLVTLLGCTEGGQSSDDGAPFDGGPHRPPDADVPEHTVVVGGTLDGDVELGCGAGFTGVAGTEDPRAAILEAPFFCRGYGSRWSCECDGREATSNAFGCEAALYEACEVAAQAIVGKGEAAAPSMCESTALNLAGRCSRQDDGDYDCDCGHALGEPRPPSVIEVEGEGTPASCELALFRACGKPCAGEYGACMIDEGAIRSYACTCSTNGLSRTALAYDCDAALANACSPVVDASESCTGYGGYCLNTDPVEGRTMHCACADGSEHNVDHTPFWIEERAYACRETLEDTCGLGSPPDAAQCLGEGNGHRARCTRGPDSDGPLVCECYLDGDPGLYVHGSSVESATCDRELLEDVCPEIAPLPDRAEEAACDHYETCERPMVGFERDSCIASVSDACAACVIGERARLPALPDGCPDDRVQCYSPCETIVPREIGVGACEQLLEDQSLLTPETSCLCDACYPAFGKCIADAGCSEISACARQQDCTLQTCEMDAVCGPLIMEYGGTPSLGLAIQLGSCENRDACAE